MDIRTFLLSHREVCPTWLASFQVGDPLDCHQFFCSRTVYYPGCGSDGHAVRMFGSSHSAHCFIYVDYWVDQSRFEFYLNSQSGRFRGYHILANIHLSESDLAPRGWVPHIQNSRNGHLKENFKPYAFLVILERDAAYGDQHGAHRLAVLFVGGDGIASYDALYCQNNGVWPPYAVLLHDHGFGGNYDKFGSGGLLEKIAFQCSVLPPWLVVASGTVGWMGYRKIDGLDGEGSGMNRLSKRFLHRLVCSFPYSSRYPL